MASLFYCQKTKNSKNPMKETKIATVNNVAIIVNDDSNELVPIRPICEALGIDAKAQRDRIERDEILKSTGVMVTSVAADGKDREMLCLPIEYIFGWLFSVDTSRVNEEARPSLIKYKKECYEVLYKHFTEPLKFIRQQQVAANALMDQYKMARTNFRNAKKIMDDYYNSFEVVRKLTIEDWRKDNSQFEIKFLNVAEEGDSSC